MQDIGRAIRIIRFAKRLRLGGVAKAAGLSVPFLSLVETGKRHPSLDVLRRLAEALDVPPGVLILVSASKHSTLRDTDRRVKRLVDDLRKLMNAEDALCARLEQVGWVTQ